VPCIHMRVVRLHHPDRSNRLFCTRTWLLQCCSLLLGCLQYNCGWQRNTVLLSHDLRQPLLAVSHDVIRLPPAAAHATSCSVLFTALQLIRASCNDSLKRHWILATATPIPPRLQSSLSWLHHPHRTITMIMTAASLPFHKAQTFTPDSFSLLTAETGLRDRQRFGATVLVTSCADVSERQSVTPDNRGQTAGHAPVASQ
jgi:hypothetical protein